MKNKVEVTISGNRFTMTGEQDEEYMTKIAALVDNRVGKIRANGVNMLQAITLTACDMADNYVQAVQSAENLRTQVSGYQEENKALQQEISDLKTHIAEHEQDMASVDQFKDRIAELEAQVQATASEQEYIAELEQELTEVEAQAKRVSELEQQLAEAKKCVAHVTELEQKLADAEKQHNNDVKQAEATESELKKLRAKAADSDKVQRHTDELEKTLIAINRELKEMSLRLTRMVE